MMKLWFVAHTIGFFARFSSIVTDSLSTKLSHMLFWRKNSNFYFIDFLYNGDDKDIVNNTSILVYTHLAIVYR